MEVYLNGNVCFRLVKNNGVYILEFFNFLGERVTAPISFYIYNKTTSVRIFPFGETYVLSCYDDYLIGFNNNDQYLLKSRTEFDIIRF